MSKEDKLVQTKLQVKLTKLANRFKVIFKTTRELG